MWGKVCTELFYAIIPIPWFFAFANLLSPHLIILSIFLLLLICKHFIRISTVSKTKISELEIQTVCLNEEPLIEELLSAWCYQAF